MRAVTMNMQLESTIPHAGPPFIHPLNEPRLHQQQGIWLLACWDQQSLHLQPSAFHLSTHQEQFSFTKAPIEVLLFNLFLKSLTGALGTISKGWEHRRHGGKSSFSLFKN